MIKCDIFFFFFNIYCGSYFVNSLSFERYEFISRRLLSEAAWWEFLTGNVDANVMVRFVRSEERDENTLHVSHGAISTNMESE